MQGNKITDGECQKFTKKLANLISYVPSSQGFQI